MMRGVITISNLSFTKKVIFGCLIARLITFGKLSVEERLNPILLATNKEGVIETRNHQEMVVIAQNTTFLHDKKRDNASLEGSLSHGQ